LPFGLSRKLRRFESARQEQTNDVAPLPRRSRHIVAQPLRVWVEAIQESTRKPHDKLLVFGLVCHGRLQRTLPPLPVRFARCRGQLGVLRREPAQVYVFLSCANGPGGTGHGCASVAPRATSEVTIPFSELIGAQGCDRVTRVELQNVVVSE